MIDGCEHAWVFFGGVFGVLVPDNLSAVAAKADPVGAWITDAFTEYAQSGGFVIDPARCATPRTSRGSSAP